jgi:hypothetical protein
VNARGANKTCFACCHTQESASTIMDTITWLKYTSLLTVL